MRLQNRIKEEADPNAQIIFGTAFDQDLGDRIRVSVVATGIDNDRYIQSASNHNVNTTPNVTQSVSEPKRSEKPVLNRETINEVISSKSFVPPQPQKVEESKDVFLRPTQQPEIQQAQPSEDEAKSLFSRMSSNFSRMSTGNTIDIPAILRRNNPEEDK